MCKFFDVTRKSNINTYDSRETGVQQSIGLLSYGLTVRGSNVGRGNRFFKTSKPALGPTQPPMQCLRGFLFAGVKLPEHKSNHSPQSSAEAKNECSQTSTTKYTFIA
jgi:hypothetical protein